MAAIDYHGILLELQAILKADSSFQNLPVEVEQEPYDLSSAGRAIVLGLSRRRQTSGQPISAGKGTRYHVYISIWCAGYSTQYAEAAKFRDELTGQLELVLMNNRTASGKLAAGYLEGGEFATFKIPAANAICAMAETIFVGEALAVAP